MLQLKDTINPYERVIFFIENFQLISYIQKFIFFAGRHSFGVYMVHWVIMLKVMEYLPMQSELFFVYLAKIVIIIFMFSLIIGTIFDNTLIKLGKKLMSIALRIRRL